MNQGFDAETESADLFDYDLIRDWLSYVAGAVSRRRRLALAVLVSLVGLTAAGLKVLPKTYKVEARILAQRNSTIATLGNPGVYRPGDSDAPTRAASETILNRDNLVALIKQTALLDLWDVNRAPILRVKDKLMGLLRQPVSDEDKIEALLAILDKRLTVTAGDGTVSISLEWPDGQMCYRLVEAALQNFLEARHVSEISAIAEAISILEGHAAGFRDSLDEDLDELRRLREAKAGTVRAAAPLRRARAEDPERLELKLMVAAKRRAIFDLEDFRHRRLAELQAELAKQKVMYSEQHPIVLGTQQMIDSLLVDSPQLVELRKEEGEMVAELVRHGGTAADVDQQQALPALAMAREPEPPEPKRAAAEEDPAILAARSRISYNTLKYNALLDRIESARIELDTARAAFKYRYSVIRPPQVPKKAVKPNAPMVMIASVIAGLFLGVLAAVAADLRSGLLLHAWQAERELGLPILARVEAP